MTRKAATVDMGLAAYRDWIVNHPKFSELNLDPKDILTMTENEIGLLMSKLPLQENIDFLTNRIADVRITWDQTRGRLQSTLPPVR